MSRAKELAGRRHKDTTLKEVRETLGGPGVSDEEFLSRYIMKGEQEIKAMRAAGSPKQYFRASQPLITLIQELEKHKKVRYVRVQRVGDSLTLQNQALT